MDHHIKEYYCQFQDNSPRGNFHKVISLNDPHVSWEAAIQYVPKLCKGWYELTRLSTRDRIDFTRDFWLSKLSYHTNLNDFLNRFFASLDDIVVYIIQKKFDDPFEGITDFSAVCFRLLIMKLSIWKKVFQDSPFHGITFPFFRSTTAFVKQQTVQEGFCSIWREKHEKKPSRPAICCWMRRSDCSASAVSRKRHWPISQPRPG